MSTLIQVATTICANADGIATFPAPTVAAPNRILVGWATQRNQVTPALPAGFTELARVGDNAFAGYDGAVAFWKLADGGQAYAIAQGGGAGVGGLVEVADADVAGADQLTANGAAPAANPDFGSLGSLLIGQVAIMGLVVGIEDAATDSAAAGWTKRLGSFSISCVGRPRTYFATAEGPVGSLEAAAFMTGNVDLNKYGGWAIKLVDTAPAGAGAFSGEPGGGVW